MGDLGLPGAPGPKVLCLEQVSCRGVPSALQPGGGDAAGGQPCAGVARGMLVSGFLLEQSSAVAQGCVELHPGDAPWAPTILHLSWVQDPSELRFLNVASNERVDGVTMIVRTDVALGDQ